MTVRSVRRRLALGLTHGWLSNEGRSALPATAGWQRRRLLKQVRMVEVGPVGEGPSRSTFVVTVYKDLERPRRFFPVVFRRAPYRLKRSFPERGFLGEVETIDPAFAPEAFARGSCEAVLKSVLKRIRTLHAKG